MEYGMLPSTGTVGGFYDNAMAESVNGAYKSELVWRREPFHDLKDLELATFRWVSWWNSTAAPVPGLQDTGSGGNRVLYESSGASRLTIKAEQKTRPLHYSSSAACRHVRGVRAFRVKMTETAGQKGIKRPPENVVSRGSQ